VINIRLIGLIEPDAFVSFESTQRGTPVSAACVSIVALLGADHQAITADAFAHVGSGRIVVMTVPTIFGFTQS